MIKARIVGNLQEEVIIVGFTSGQFTDWAIVANKDNRLSAVSIAELIVDYKELEKGC